VDISCTDRRENEVEKRERKRGRPLDVRPMNSANISYADRTEKWKKRKREGTKAHRDILSFLTFFFFSFSFSVFLGGFV
jgi:hypothetical protein